LTLRRLGLALILTTLAATFLVTLYPFRFDFENTGFWRVDWRLYYPGHSDRDLLQNLAMLVPLGVGLAMFRSAASVRRIVLEACVLGVGTAITVETLQVFEPARFPQLADVWRNGLGCIAGALVAVVLIRRAAGWRRAGPAPADG
jgi:glycopeptide antibiotics resistance protein